MYTLVSIKGKQVQNLCSAATVRMEGRAKTTGKPGRRAEPMKPSRKTCLLFAFQAASHGYGLQETKHDQNLQTRRFLHGSRPCFFVLDGRILGSCIRGCWTAFDNYRFACNK